MSSKPISRKTRHTGAKMLRRGLEITLLAATVLGSAIAQPPAQNADKDAMYVHFTNAQASL